MSSWVCVLYLAKTHLCWARDLWFSLQNCEWVSISSSRFLIRKSRSASATVKVLDRRWFSDFNLCTSSLLSSNQSRTGSSLQKYNTEASKCALFVTFCFWFADHRFHQVLQQEKHLFSLRCDPWFRCRGSRFEKTAILVHSKIGRDHEQRTKHFERSSKEEFTVDLDDT